MKSFLYGAARSVGLFRLTARAYSDRLRIVCFHGVAVADEHLWHPGLFLDMKTFRQRLASIKSGGFKVLDLDEALRRLRHGTLPEHSLVITFDDGFSNNFSLALPVLREYGFPFTVYTSSYHVTHASPVFRLAIQYLLWKWSLGSSRLSEQASFRLDLAHVHEELKDCRAYDLHSSEERLMVQNKLIEFGEAHLTDERRTEVLRCLAKELGLSEEMRRLEEDRIFHFMTPQELSEMEASGLARIELHTHSHPILTSPEQTHREVQVNKRTLEAIVGRSLHHFCYPSGVWSEKFWPALEQNEIGSATTCEPGLISTQTPRFAMGRYLDSATNSNLEFEAEIYGFAEFMRSMRGRSREKGHQGYGVARGS